MENTYITVDIEEWYDLDYLKGHETDRNIEVIPEITGFLDLLDELNVKATFFVLANTLEKNADIIREISKRGHAIGCHGYDHELLYNKDIEQFKSEVLMAKEMIEQSVKCAVQGYRASCFSMERDKLDVLKKNGYQFDSSYIKFEQHTLYKNLDLDGFKKIDDLVYRKDDFFEYEIPTLKIRKYNIPISGGGYLRMFPFWMLKILIKKYAKKKNSFLLYLHPFELTSMDLPLPKELSYKNKFRISVGRKNNIKKIRKVIKFLKSMGSEFPTIEQDMKAKVK